MIFSCARLAESAAKPIQTDSSNEREDTPHIPSIASIASLHQHGSCQLCHFQPFPHPVISSPDFRSFLNYDWLCDMHRIRVFSFFESGSNLRI
jgi:hypothetical protein